MHVFLDPADCEQGMQYYTPEEVMTGTETQVKEMMRKVLEGQQTTLVSHLFMQYGSMFLVSCCHQARLSVYWIRQIYMYTYIFIGLGKYTCIHTYIYIYICIHIYIIYEYIHIYTQ